MTAVELEIRIPDTVEEFLAACGEEGDGWVLALFGSRSVRRFLRSPKAERYEIANVPVRWTGPAPSRVPGLYRGRAEYHVSERVAVARDALLRGPLGEAEFLFEEFGPFRLEPGDYLNVTIHLTIKL